MAEKAAYSFDGQHETSVSEEDDKDGNAEVKGEQVHTYDLLFGARGESVVVRATGNLYSLPNEPGKYGNDKGIIAQQVKQVKFLLHCLYCSIYFYFLFKITWR